MNFLVYLEGIRTPFWNIFFSIITYLGRETVFLALALVLVWCVNKKYGFFILYCGLIGQSVSQYLKIFFKVERPWIANSDFKPIESAIAEAKGFSFPSGHTQIATTTYGGLALLYRRYKWFSVSMVAIVLLVAFSRMYLGVHYPSDVLFSLIFNSLLVILFYYLGKHFSSQKFSNILRVLAIAVIGSIFVYSFVKSSISLDVAAYADTLDFSSKMFGASSAFVISWYVDEKWLNYQTEASFGIQFAKAVPGIVLLVSMKEGLKYLFKMIGTPHLAANFIRYFAIVIFAGTIWPWIFMKFVKRK